MEMVLIRQEACTRQPVFWQASVISLIREAEAEQ